MRFTASDITKLATATRGKYLNAYVIEDIYSRKIIHAQVHERECAHLAAEFLDQAIEANGGVVPGYVHSDNGGGDGGVVDQSVFG